MRRLVLRRLIWVYAVRICYFFACIQPVPQVRTLNFRLATPLDYTQSNWYFFRLSSFLVLVTQPFCQLDYLEQLSDNSHFEIHLFHTLWKSPRAKSEKLFEEEMRILDELSDIFCIHCRNSRLNMCRIADHRVPCSYVFAKSWACSLPFGLSLSANNRIY